MFWTLQTSPEVLGRGHVPWTYSKVPQIYVVTAMLNQVSLMLWSTGYLMMTWAQNSFIVQYHPTGAKKSVSTWEDQLKKGFIWPSHSDYASPIVLVRKKSGLLRMCVDYRLMNSRTRKDAYPLPRIEEYMHALHGARYFSVIDLQSAFNQVAMDERDSHKTAFTNPFGLL